ncbi:cytochrome o ubiquinol oxidase subunit IV [Variovorax sp. VNK109]|jgi:cytochrome o ubiquinol oxidase operon protein cyoD|uniref:cytochrome o ubiquinol oxidase subunit IV n=1 Tax=Variovorax sp. VNK109 TaxID=3400919 RepID=UPI003C0E64EE
MAHAHELDHDDSGYHATLGGYIKGFILAAILTIIPFALVMLKVPVSPRLLAAGILLFAVVQMVVHLVYFLHLNTTAEGGWNLLAAGFTVGILVIMMAGTTWVMYNMNTNMMPAMEHENMPGVPAARQPDAVAPAAAPPTQAPASKTP